MLGVLGWSVGEGGEDIDPSDMAGYEDWETKTEERKRWPGKSAFAARYGLWPEEDGRSGNVA